MKQILIYLLLKKYTHMFVQKFRAKVIFHLVSLYDYRLLLHEILEVSTQLYSTANTKLLKNFIVLNRKNHDRILLRFSAFISAIYLKNIIYLVLCGRNMVRTEYCFLNIRFPQVLLFPIISLQPSTPLVLIVVIMG